MNSASGYIEPIHLYYGVKKAMHVTLGRESPCTCGTEE
jgi:hypothetical protein